MTTLPVVAPAAGGPLDVVAEGQTGYLYAPEDDGALARAVRVLAADPAMRARMGEAGRRRVLPRSWEALGDALLSPAVTRRVIERVVEQPILSSSPDPRLTDLTPRELEVFLLIAQGRSNREIAA